MRAFVVLGFLFPYHLTNPSNWLEECVQNVLSGT